MTTENHGESAATNSSSEPAEILLKRDGDRPLSFRGDTLGKVCLELGMPGMSNTMCAAIYRTQGGKHVAQLTRRPGGLLNMAIALSDDGQTKHDGIFDKVFVCNTFQEAIGWFRPGKVTDALREKLGLNEPERIE